jgi:hypothetical protein
MASPPHLLLAVTAHGYGHLAQSGPVVAALARRIPGLRVTLQGDIDPAFARHRLPPGFEHIQESADVGLPMDGPLRIRWPDALNAYGAFEADYERHLGRQMGILRDLSPDLVLADVPWLPLDAARRLGIPAVGLCSLTWYDILRESPVGDRVPLAVLDRMRQVYAGADLFIRPAPSMPMAWLPNARDVGPIALRCPDRSAELRERLGLPTDRPLALMQFGGIGGLSPLHDWPEQGQVHWLVPSLGGRRRRDASGLAEQRLDAADLIGSLDLILCKPGYGTYTEAACNGIPLIYVSRGDWPEEAALSSWIEGCQIPTREISLEDLLSGAVGRPVAELLAAGRSTPVEPTGGDASAELIIPLVVPGRSSARAPG